MQCPVSLSMLQDVAVALAGGLDSELWSGPAFFVGVVAADSGALTLAVRLVEPPGAHPATMLPYLTVPDEWLALGIVGYGWSRSLDRPDHDRRRVHTVELVGRTGIGVGVVTIEGDEPLIIEHGPPDTNEPSGLVADGLRRALGLPTPPCAVTPLEYVARVWLSGIDDWEPAHGALVDALLARAAATDWTRMRMAAANGIDVGVAVDPDLAAWMDDDMFARCAIAGLPSLDEVREELSRRVPAGAVAQIDAVLAARGLPPNSDQAAC